MHMKLLHLLSLLGLQIVKTNQIKNITKNSFQLIDLHNFKFIINSGMYSQIYFGHGNDVIDY